MSNARSSPLLEAVTAYVRRARERLAPDQVETAVRLLKEVNRRLPGRNLLEATLAELKASGARLFAEGGEPREHSRFLSAELREFFDAALAEGLVVRHPITGAVRLPGPDEMPAAVPGAAETAEQAAKVVANLVEDAVRTGLMLSPLAVPVAELGEGTSQVEEALVFLACRWSWLASQMHWMLQVVRVMVPLGAVVFGLSAAFSADNPLTGGAKATLSSQALQELRIAVNLLENLDPRQADVGSLEELGDRIGVPLVQSANLFTLERTVPFPPILYLRHRESGTLVVMTPEHRWSLRNGRWRMLR